MALDNYWTYICLQSIDNENENTFASSLDFIDDEQKRQLLMRIKDAHDAGDSSIISLVKKVTNNAVIVHFT